MKELDQIILVGKSLKGKNRIHEVGTNQWFIVRIERSVIFDKRPGPWLLVAPIPKTDLENANVFSRWVHLINDKDFMVKL